MATRSPTATSSPLETTSSQVVHTPGHAPDHVALWHAGSRTLFSGDLVSTGTTVVILASHGGSSSQYLASLRRVLCAGARAAAARARRPRSTIRRRSSIAIWPIGACARSRSSLRLRDGLETVNAIVDRIYVGLSDPLVPMARESVLAHLMKLEDEGRAAQQRRRSGSK